MLIKNTSRKEKLIKAEMRAHHTTATAHKSPKQREETRELKAKIQSSFEGPFLPSAKFMLFYPISSLVPPVLCCEMRLTDGKITEKEKQREESRRQFEVEGGTPIHQPRMHLIHGVFNIFFGIKGPHLQPNRTMRSRTDFL